MSAVSWGGSWGRLAYDGHVWTMGWLEPFFLSLLILQQASPGWFMYWSKVLKKKKWKLQGLWRPRFRTGMIKSHTRPDWSVGNRWRFSRGTAAECGGQYFLQATMSRQWIEIRTNRRTASIFLSLASRIWGCKSWLVFWIHYVILNKFFNLFVDFNHCTSFAYTSLRKQCSSS